MKKRLPGNLPYDEKELLLNLAGGDEAAFFEIYRRYSGKVYRMSLDYLQSAFVAKDIVQDTFIKLWQQRHLAQDIRSVDAWLTTVTKNQLINHLRKKIPATEADMQVADSGDRYIDYRELEVLVHQAVEQLPKQQKKVYELSRFSGMPHREIAEQLGISYDMAREHLSKALKNIRQFLEKHYGSLAVIPLLLI